MTEYLTAAQLGIQEWEREALLAVAERLRSMGNQPAVPLDQDSREYRSRVTDGPDFCMNVPLERRGCGSVGCIGGHVWLRGPDSEGVSGEYAELQAMLYVDDACGVLSRLYYPWEVNPERWGDITPAMAAQAIDGVLRRHDPAWAAIVPWEWVTESEED